jgi:hypothetical protein
MQARTFRAKAPSSSATTGLYSCSMLCSSASTWALSCLRFPSGPAKVCEAFLCAVHVWVHESRFRCCLSAHAITRGAQPVLLLKSTVSFCPHDINECSSHLGIVSFVMCAITIIECSHPLPERHKPFHAFIRLCLLLLCVCAVCF